MHQAYIDLEQTCDSSKLYAGLYWPDAAFRVIDEKSGRYSVVRIFKIDLRYAQMFSDGKQFTGHQQIRGNFDYAHSVFPLYQWRHSMGVFQIYDAPAGPNGTMRAKAHWNWRVDWKANQTGVVSTGYYDDVYEKRNGVWKVFHRVSRDDPNWPIQIFAPYIANELDAFKSSCGDTSL